MERKDQTLLALAEKRNTSIPERIRGRLVYTPPFSEKTDRMRRIADFYIRRFQVQGVENLTEGVHLSENGKLIIASNHQTDLDHAAKRHILEALGFREFADRLVYPSGLKMNERLYIRFFMGAEHSVFIATPADIEAAAGILFRNKKDAFLSQAQVETLQTYRQNLRDLNQIAAECLADLNRCGLVTAIYPEAGRTRHPQSLIKRAAPAVALYTYQQEDEPEGYVLPMSVGGLNRVLPPNKLMRFWRKSSLTVVFGKPYPFKEVWDKRRVKTLKEMGAEKSDYMMAKIAQLNWSLVDPKDRPFYEQVNY